MKSVQSFLFAAIVIAASGCASNAAKQPAVAALPVTQSTAAAPATAATNAPLTHAISATHVLAPRSEASEEMTNLVVSDARLPVDADSTMPPSTASNTPADGSIADAERTATAGKNAGALSSAKINDPWERYNRAMYWFNTKADKYVARPIGVAYDTVVPIVVQRRVTSFFANLQEPRTMVNQLLQGRPVGAARTLGRFAVNTTVGIGGIFDPASKLELERANEDFGQTLAVWGWTDSRFFVAPLQGPKTIRDFISGFGDEPLNPAGYINDDRASMAVTIVHIGSMRSAALPSDKKRAEALDEYSSVRDAWMQRRAHQIDEKK